MVSHWPSCGSADTAAAAPWWEVLPPWFSAAGTFTAASVAIWIAYRQRAAEERVLAGVQREKAAHVALEDLDPSGVTVRNHGQTPVTNVRLVTVEAYLDEDEGEGEWVTGGRARARHDPAAKDLLPAGEAVRFLFTGWSSPEGLHLSEDLRWGRPRVTLAYTDAAGTRWRREQSDLPVAWGGTPLPGAATERRRVARRKRRRRWGQRWRVIRKSLRHGLRGRGFTREQRRKWRTRQRERGPAA
jgi:hypothetical protein